MFAGIVRSKLPSLRLVGRLVVTGPALWVLALIAAQWQSVVEFDVAAPILFLLPLIRIWFGRFSLVCAASMLVATTLWIGYKLPPSVKVTGRIESYAMSGCRGSLDEIGRIGGTFGRDQRILLRLYYYRDGQLKCSSSIIAGTTHWRWTPPMFRWSEYSIALLSNPVEGGSQMQLGVTNSFPNECSKEAVFVPDFSCTIVNSRGPLVERQEKVIYSRLDASQSSPSRLSVAETLNLGARNAVLVTAMLTDAESLKGAFRR